MKVFREAEKIKLFQGVNNILVIKLRHIGDVLLTVPAIRALRESFPHARLSALVNSGTEDMLTLNPLVDEVISFKRSIKGLHIGRRVSGELKLIKDLRGKKFDLTVDLTGGDRPAFIAFSIGAKYRLGYVPRRGFAGKRLLYTHLAKRPSIKTHTVLRDLGLLREFGIDTKDFTVDIHTSPADDASIDKALKEAGYDGGSFAHVHPTSRWLFKCWTDTGMAYVLDMLEDSGVRVVLTSGPDEKERKKIASIVSLMRTRPVDLSGKITLKQLASLSKRASFFFGVDTAPMHIAAAVGARVVSIFGPSGAFDWGPWDNKEANGWALKAENNGWNSPYTQKGGVQRFGKNMVIQMDWDCVPCGKAGCEGTGVCRCLEDLDAESVWNIVKGMISGC
ncbi:MAG: putative lipopolysaccharide heptosyltransferase III [Deltaproteobacteria bacterium]|nr:putative lipopolysaccharide heptosyltransferase III [Deltaproteobacteria bacterium]